MKCEICGTEHEGYQAHVFVNQLNGGENQVSDVKPLNEINSVGVKRSRESYNAYMREYMRKRRAKAKHD